MTGDTEAALMARLQDHPGAALLASLPPYVEAEALATAVRLRAQGHDPELVAAALTQTRLRARARHRLGDLVDELLLTADGVEQATRPPVSLRRAQRFARAGVEHVHDLGCGLGLDSRALAQVGLSVTATELDPVVAAAARANLATFPRVRVVEGDATQVTPDLAGGAFLDPARRVAGVADAGGRTRRVLRLEELSPSWAHVRGVAAQTRATGAKLSPAFPRSEVPTDALAEWVSLDGDVLECALWWGSAAPNPGRVAVVGRTEDGSTTWHEVHPPTGEPGPLEEEARLGAWLAEPDRAVIAAGLTGALATAVEGQEVGPGAGYVSAPAPVEVPWARWYAVQEVLPLHAKVVRGWLRARGADRVTLKKRGVRLDPDAFRRELRLPRRSTGGPEVTMVLTTVAGTARAVVVEPRSS